MLICILYIGQSSKGRKFSILLSITSKVIRGHIRSLIYLKILYYFDKYFVSILILPKLFVKADIMRTHIFHKIKYALQGYTRSDD